MNRKPITDLKNAHPGADIWIIAAGPSLDFVAPHFFRNRLTIGVNSVYERFPCSYLVRKERAGAEEAFQSNIPLILSEGNCGNHGERNEVSGPAYYFSHRDNQHQEVDLSVIGTDEIVVSWSTITSAIHVAAYMGAGTIFLCGHDCGTLDGNCTYQGYYPDGYPDHDWYQRWVKKIGAQTRLVCKRLSEVYGCHIHSLNPFVDGFALEGHIFQG